jgi:monovalent cation:H+ antiporter-2, CPA2 family
MYESTLIEIVILLALAVAVLAVFNRLNFSPVLGYMAVGIMIGNHGLDVIKNVEGTRHFAEYGVVFLLFIIGLELTFERLREMRLHVFGFGTLQVFLCAAILGQVIYIMTGDMMLSFVIGFVLSLSSTAVVLQVLADRGETSTQHGRLSLANLILQDLAFVPLLIIIPLLADKDANILYGVGKAILHASIALVLIAIVGKKFLGPLYRMVALMKSQELFLATTLLILLGSAWITQQYNLSLALGAFVAGLLVAETEYRTQVETDLKPFKGLLMGLFFISVGMTLDIEILRSNIVIIAMLTVTLILSKTFVIYGLARIFGFRRSSSIKTGMMLSQGSEFAFVLLALASENKVIDDQLKQIIIVTVAISMALTPLLAILAKKIARRIDIKNPVHYDGGDIEDEVSDLDNHVIVIGFDRVGKTTCDLLKYKEINYIILDDDPRSVHYGRKNGYPIFFGKTTQTDNIEKMGLDRAKLVAVLTSNQKETTILVKHLRKKYPDVFIIARAKDREHAADLKKYGSNIIIAENFESSLMMGNFILSSLGVSPKEVESAIERFRDKEYPDSQVKGVVYKARETVDSI